MSYSPFFKTLYDQTHPVGDLGRGTHYSVLRAATWHDEFLDPLQTGAFLDFAVIWDQDHDSRVIAVVERFYFAGLLAPVRFIGERKGCLFVLLSADVLTRWGEAELTLYKEQLEQEMVGADLGDLWPVAVHAVSGLSPIINASDWEAEIYLQHVQILWKLGVKPYSNKSGKPAAP